MKKLLVALPLVLASAYGYAANDSITKSVKPDNIIVVNGGSGMAQFTFSSSNFPSGTGTKTKTITSIEWGTTYYPNNNDEEIEMCYYKPYSSVTPTRCMEIPFNSSGTTNYFNYENFGPGAKVIYRHKINGGQQPGQPAGNDTITVHYSY